MTQPAGIPEQSDKPYGTEPRRSNTPIYVLGVLYLLWFGVLVWMAFYYHPK